MAFDDIFAAFFGIGGANNNGGGSRGRGLPTVLLRLACHRDAVVRALSFAVLAEVQPDAIGADLSENAKASDEIVGVDGEIAELYYDAKASLKRESGRRRDCERDVGRTDWGGGGRHRPGEEMVQACVRTAGDGFYESLAVRTEALRFLSRCVRFILLWDNRLCCCCEISDDAI